MANVIRDGFFKHKQWVEGRGKSRGVGGVGWWGSADARRLNSKVNGKLFDDNNSPYSLGFDFLECFSFKDHSVGVMVIRCEDHDDELRAKRGFHRPLMIIPGVKQPKSLDVYVNLVLEDFVTYGPDSGGLRVTPLGGSPFQHIIFLSGVYCDSPARQKLACVIQGASAYLMCMYCWLCGVKDSNMRMLGYSTPVVCRYGKLRGQALQMGVRDRVRLLAHDEQVQRALVAEAGTNLDPAKDIGVRRLNPFVRLLPYVDFNTLFPVPFYHALYLGVVKDFFGLLLDSKTSFAMKKKVVSSREGHIILPADFARPVLSVVSKQGRMVIENWVRLLEVYSTYLFWPSLASSDGDVLPATAKEAWGHLRRFALYYQRYEECGAEERRRRRKTARSASAYFSTFVSVGDW